MTKPQTSVNRIIGVLNGPNLNLLGTRETAIYGSLTLEGIKALCAETAKDTGYAIDFRQSNSEGELVNAIQEMVNTTSGLVINPAAYTHTSVAILDALRAYPHQVIEVHLSNIYQREEFRRHSYVSLRADGVISGLGGTGYRLAILALVR
ncbi:MAG: type II 3-dehydroquinate dehydratase [Holosporales bacterium]|jgi:3-dehydroquinate dehydratase-2